MQKKKCTANAPIHRVLNPKDNWALQTPNAKVVVPLAGCVMGIAMFVKSLGKESFGVGEETNELMVQSMIGFLGGSHWSWSIQTIVLPRGWSTSWMCV